MIISLFAHAEEVHENNVESTIHSLGPWYVALLLVTAVLIAIGYLVWVVSGRKFGSVLLFESICLLLIGFVAATSYPLISVITLTIGIFLAGFLAFAGLANGK